MTNDGVKQGGGMESEERLGKNVGFAGSVPSGLEVFDIPAKGCREVER